MLFLIITNITKGISMNREDSRSKGRKEQNEGGKVENKKARLWMESGQKECGHRTERKSSNIMGMYIKHHFGMSTQLTF